ncbi:MAG: imidazole glycerol phosphate synthase subunit HisH [Kiritimatiellia bacterium]
MIAIVDYNAGNLTSVKLAFETLDCDVEVTQNAETILKADHVVFPGVGAAGAAMRSLSDLQLIEPIKKVAAGGTPFLGICLGTQILFDFSDEDCGIPTLGILPGHVPRFQPENQRDKVPQIGWNQVECIRPHPLMDGIENRSEFYFVHSYYPAPENDAIIIGTTQYADTTFASMVGCANVAATQFHPEKSGAIGLKMLKNFIDWKPAPLTPNP